MLIRLGFAMLAASWKRGWQLAFLIPRLGAAVNRSEPMDSSLASHFSPHFILPTTRKDYRNHHCCNFLRAFRLDPIQK